MMITTSAAQRHPLEDDDSWNLHVDRRRTTEGASRHRRLHHHQHEHDDEENDVEKRNSSYAKQVEKDVESKYWKELEEQQSKNQEIIDKEKKKHKKLMHELYANPGIESRSVHGLMIDAGSTGSRLHVYEWQPRILKDEKDIQAAVSGEKLSFPGTESRWTDRLQPGISTFGSIADDDELQQAVAEYLNPLLDFAKTVLHEKQSQFEEFPIFLRATAGMRILQPKDRARVIKAVRNLFSNSTYCPFAFVDEQARVLSGEEESIYDWAGVNFVMGQLIEESEGAGTVVNPVLTHGALDLGGASTQISFYQTNEDIMANLFKLQIGQAKHWNVYAHSFLFYGMNEAIERFHARLAGGKPVEQRLVEGVYNPCLPGGSKKEVRTNIHISSDGVETWNYTQVYPSGNGFYQALLKNDKARGDAQACLALTRELLHLEKNDWCDFAHQGDCSLAGIYQPRLPSQHEAGFGEFVAFSNYYHVWQFLKLPERATVAQLYNATLEACSMSRDELLYFNNGTVSEDEDLDSYCFRSAYTFQLLRNGYGFDMDDVIRVSKVIDGHKVGWALGAMLYEINAMPWKYVNDQKEIFETSFKSSWDAIAIMLIIFGMFASLGAIFCRRQRKWTQYSEYEPIKEVSMHV